MTTDAATTSLGVLAAAQRSDGSWGRSEEAPARIVPTIFAARSLQEAGTPGVDRLLGRALDFLADRAIVAGGCSIRGTRDSVLCCYTGMAAVLFLRDHRHETAQPLIEWILRYQAIAFGGRTYLEPEGHWGSYLQHRYGGCMATTTCLLGLIPTMTALVEARRSPLAVDTSVHEAAFRDLLIDRRLMHGRNGEIMPLAGRTKADPHGIRWLRPAFPLDYVADLIGLAQAARDVGVPWDAMPEARALIRSWELPAGGWPMLGKRRIEFAHRPERVDRSARSQIITRRVRDLMSATGSAPGTAGGSLSDEVGGPCAVAPG